MKFFCFFCSSYYFPPVIEQSMFLLFIYWQDSPSFRDELKAMLEASGVREYFRYVFIYLSGVWSLIINKFFSLSFSRSRGLSDLSLPWKNPTAEGKEAADQRRKKYFSQVCEEERKINDRCQNILNFLFLADKQVGCDVPVPQVPRRPRAVRLRDRAVPVAGQKQRQQLETKSFFVIRFKCC